MGFNTETCLYHSSTDNSLFVSVNIQNISIAILSSSSPPYPLGKRIRKIRTPTISPESNNPNHIRFSSIRDLKNPLQSNPSIDRYILTQPSQYIFS
jgi:hypothetical protein